MRDRRCESRQGNDISTSGQRRWPSQEGRPSVVEDDVSAPRRGAEGDGEHDAACGKNADVVLSVYRRGAVERISVGGSVCSDVVSDCAVGVGEAGDAVLIEEIVDAEAKLRAVEAARAADGVVEEDVGDVEGIDGGLVVIGAVVLVLSADALVEEGSVPGAALIGEADGFDVRGSLLNPHAAGHVDGDGWCRRRATGSAGGAADCLRAGVDGVIVAGVEICAEAVSEVDVAFAFDALCD